MIGDGCISVLPVQHLADGMLEMKQISKYYIYLVPASGKIVVLMTFPKIIVNCAASRNDFPAVNQGTKLPDPSSSHSHRT